MRSFAESRLARGRSGLGFDESAREQGQGSLFLTGLAHGAAGIGLALLELHKATGRADFLEAGLGAFAYEDSLFDPRQGNWPDLRGFDAVPDATKAATYPLAWCHGAPGYRLGKTPGLGD